MLPKLNPEQLEALDLRVLTYETLSQLMVQKNPDTLPLTPGIKRTRSIRDRQLMFGGKRKRGIKDTVVKVYKHTTGLNDPLEEMEDGFKERMTAWKSTMTSQTIKWGKMRQDQKLSTVATWKLGLKAERPRMPADRGLWQYLKKNGEYLLTLRREVDRMKTIKEGKPGGVGAETREHRWAAGEIWGTAFLDSEVIQDTDGRAKLVWNKVEERNLQEIWSLFEGIGDQSMNPREVKSIKRRRARIRTKLKLKYKTYNTDIPEDLVEGMVV